MAKKVLSINDLGQKVAGDLNADDVLNLRYVHTQTVPSDVWDINHKLNREIIVQLYNTAGQEIEGEVIRIDSLKTSVHFAYPISGTAIII